ncbi:unnamed protein product [Amoebophrya sp. A120]|nr:unnamed protein product [Amoebophrya sp. A120]|eukprot:GSA120T00022149001.1
MGNPQRGTKKKKQNKKGKTYNVVRKQHGGKPKDHDQVHANLKPENRAKIETETAKNCDEDLPGLGRNYCISCDQHFVTKEARDAHFKSKAHKRRLKAVLSDPHTQAEAEELGKH